MLFNWINFNLILFILSIISFSYLSNIHSMIKAQFNMAIELLVQWINGKFLFKILKSLDIFTISFTLFSHVTFDLCFLSDIYHLSKSRNLMYMCCINSTLFIFCSSLCVSLVTLATSECTYNTLSMKLKYLSLSIVYINIFKDIIPSMIVHFKSINTWNVLILISPSLHRLSREIVWMLRLLS